IPVATRSRATVTTKMPLGTRPRAAASWRGGSSGVILALYLAGELARQETWRRSEQARRLKDSLLTQQVGHGFFHHFEINGPLELRPLPLFVENELARRRHEMQSFRPDFNRLIQE